MLTALGLVFIALYVLAGIAVGWVAWRHATIEPHWSILAGLLWLPVVLVLIGAAVYDALRGRQGVDWS